MQGNIAAFVKIIMKGVQAFNVFAIIRHLI